MVEGLGYRVWLCAERRQLSHAGLLGLVTHHAAQFLLLLSG